MTDLNEYCGGDFPMRLIERSVSHHKRGWYI